MKQQDKFKFTWLLQPLLIAISPAIHIFVLNSCEIPKLHLLFALTFIAIATLLLFLSSSLLYKSFFKGALVTNALILLFYGSAPIIHNIFIPISKYFFNFTIIGIRVLRIKYMLPVLILITLFFIHRYITKIKSDFFLRILILPLLIFIGISCAKFLFANTTGTIEMQRYNQSNERFRSNVLTQLSTHATTEKHPDIYFIILDCYTSQEYYQKVCNFDNRPFLNQLKQRGFCIPEKTHSNYEGTVYSLASILNMDYLPNKKNQRLLSHMWEHNNVAFFLKKLGYMTMDFYRSSQLPIKKSRWHTQLFHELYSFCFNYFSMGRYFLEHWTPLYPLTSSYTEKVVRKRIESKLSLLRDAIQLKSPKFIYAHFLIPHPPHVFDRNGNPLTVDTSMPDLERLHYGHVEGTKFINKEIIKIIDLILKQSKTPPIIILQGDHGYDYTCSGKLLYQILNSYYLPHGGEKKLYPSITPVNSFRVIFNHYFGTQLPLLKDKAHGTTK